ncbi:MAG: hypothetical protein KDK97_22930, partial [Verrucomicrobiales bacterium]|nr:hypothetical protein [Verrucomicrobiales bacterium]
MKGGTTGRAGGKRHRPPQAKPHDPQRARPFLDSSFLPSSFTLSLSAPMPYDPNFPPTNAELTSPAFRDQFQGLKTLIDAIPSITNAQVDSITTLNPGDPATVGVSITGGVLHFTFGIPQGAEGAQGSDGPQGPAFGNAVVDSVTTVPPGSPASVGTWFDGTDVHFTFELPQGDPGEQGPAGEVSQGDLENAINYQTSNNTNAVSTIGT